MGQRAELLTPGDTHGRLATVAPIDIETRPHPGALTQAKDFASSTYRGAKTRAVRSVSIVVDKTPSLSRASREGAREVKPLQLMLLLGGMAFILGAALRIWRSKHNE